MHRQQIVFGVLWAAGSIAAPVSMAADLMPVAQQNALVQKYCAVCHTDVAKNGGLTLQHFDAAQAAPGLKAMMLSKMTGGVLLRTATAAQSDPNAAAVVEKVMKTGAMGAAGIPVPDGATISALIHAFAVGSAGATDWNVEHSQGTLTASILREAPSASKAGQAEVYRLIATCNTTTRDGFVQLAWAPAAKAGTLAVSLDGGDDFQYSVEGSESMGNGSGLILRGPAAVLLTESKSGESRPSAHVPDQALVAGDLFPDERVTFPFANLPKDARQELSACYSDSR